ncbi:MAG: hypothetical protein B7X34_04300 [Acidobacteriia bacterium 12-62-4]|nr:MAG: hypothetical protein B7X34_04300 [Acidobacteriia bacterium 12-62-4]
MRLFPLLFILSFAACSTPEKPAATAPPPKPPKITHFYATTNPVPKGESATVCYGTEDATEVALAPYNDTLKPSMNRCIAVTPAGPTTYTLTVKGPGGETSSTLELSVGGAPTPKSAPASTPLITSFQSIGGGRVTPGKPVQFCYSTRPETVSVSSSPGTSAVLKPGQNQCFVANITKTTTYILTARDAAGSTDRMQVTVTAGQ